MNKIKSIKDVEKRLGFQLKKEQYQAVVNVLDGKDTLVIAAPSYGKSAIFHAASLVNEDKMVLVIEPTISLIMDQVNRLRSLDTPVAVSYMTSYNKAEHKEILKEIARNKITLLYVTPERLQQDSFQDAIKHCEPWLIVVDECHLVLDWGMSFRPDYLSIGKFVESLAERPVLLAMTATAPPNYRKQLFESLNMRDPDKIILSIDKPKLSIIRENVSDHKIDNPKKHIVYMLKRVRIHIKKYGTSKEGELYSTIIYCLTPDDVEMAANYLRKYYENEVLVSQGKLSKNKRTTNELDFLSGRKKIMVATSAFGQGVDKADIRLVVHYGLPLSVIDYYQQIGRAGRDGTKAAAVVLYDKGLMKKNKMLIRGLPVTVQDWMQKNQSLLEHILLGDKCFMQKILNEFGETRKKPCNHCSVCQKRR